MVDQRFQGLDIAGMGHLWPVDHRRPRPRRVFEAQLQRVDADLLGHDVERAFDRERRDRRARRAIGRRLWAVADDVVADRAGVRNVVWRERAQARIHHRRAGEGAGLEFEDTVGGGDRAVLLDADLDPHRRAGGRTGRFEHLVAAHHDLDRAAGFLRQRGCDRLEIDRNLAAKAAADLGRGHSQVADMHAEQLGGDRPHPEMALGRGPDLGLPVGVDARGAGMRLDIGLVHGRGLELLLDDDIGLGKALVEIADLQIRAFSRCSTASAAPARPRG